MDDFGFDQRNYYRHCGQSGHAIKWKNTVRTGKHLRRINKKEVMNKEYRFKVISKRERCFTLI